MTKQAFRNLPASLLECRRLWDSLGQHSEAETDSRDLLASRWTLSRHLLLLDMAMDKQVAEDLYQRRVAGTFAGICVATDESPPNASRFLWFRFQITCLYIGVVPDIAEWSGFRSPPSKWPMCSASSSIGAVQACHPPHLRATLP